jgi:penicillin-binding protein 1C
MTRFVTPDRVKFGIVARAIWQSRRGRRLRFLAILVTLFWIGWRVFRAYVGAPYDALADSSWTEASRVLARDGRLLGERPSPEGLRGHSTRLEEVSDRLVVATIASEDRRWTKHDGIDRIALVRAFASWVMHGHVVSGEAPSRNSS